MTQADLLQIAMRVAEFNVEQNKRYGSKFETLVPSIMCRFIELGVKVDE